MYSKKQIKLWFEKIRDGSYKDFCLSSQVIIEEMGFIGYSSPFNGHISINLISLNRYKYPKKAVIGIIAHELAHQVSYRRRSFIGKWLFLWNYYLSEKKRKRIEFEAEEIAIQRGYGKELLIALESDYGAFSKDKKLLAFIQRVYPTPNDIKKFMKKYPKTNRKNEL